jgi:hypothetical protein
VLHGFGPFRVQMIRNQLELNRINAVHSFKHKPCRPAVAWCRASTSWLQKMWMAGTSPAMTKDQNW